MSQAGDARFELAMAASAHERANRPRALVAGAVVALVAAALLALWGLSTLRTAKASLRATLGEQVDVEQMTGEWAHLDQQEHDGGSIPGLGRPVDGLFSKMEQLATRAGLKDKPQPPRSSEIPRGGVKVIQYTYDNVRDASLKALLEWIRLANAEIPGMELDSLTLKPDPTNWTARVVFRRWERTQ
jgi:hypothetical protein